MLGEYGVLINFNELLTEFAGIPGAMINLLQTRNGQWAAAVLLAVCILLYRRRK